MSDKTQNMNQQQIRFKLHPRVFNALGSELVTNDNVAIVELVKNSYDALSRRVDVRLAIYNDELCLEIEDNGIGMTRDIIENVWCVVATPYKMINPTTNEGEKRRRVSGEKGLGRLSAARLGKKLELITKSAQEDCWKINIAWDDLSKADSLEQCNILLERYGGQDLINDTGTLIRILDLQSEWNEDKIQELQDQLSRLVSPFEQIEDFGIYLTVPGLETKSTKIESPEFLEYPTYMLRGTVTSNGDVIYDYSFNFDNRSRIINGARDNIWQERRNELEEANTNQLSFEGIWSFDPKCGPFIFEIRAWDRDPDSMALMAERFDIKKATITKDIKSYKGISLYRDNILVLPKSESARDWLGLDLRRVSKVGTRMSTSQIVGYVSISSDLNPNVNDTSDRERLVDNIESSDLKYLLKRVVEILERERTIDKDEGKSKEPPFQDLFGELSPKEFIDKVNEIKANNGTIGEVLPLAEAYSAHIEETIKQLEQRLTYYSRLASLGVLSSLLVHEVRNHTQAVGGLLNTSKKMIDEQYIVPTNFSKNLGFADKGIRALERLAERFSPLANRNLRNKRRNCILENIIQDCVSMREIDINAKNIQVNINSDENNEVSADPGDLTAIFVNLLDNSIYWLSSLKDKTISRQIHIDIRKLNPRRLYIEFNDSGPGIFKGEEERIFWPGVTRKPDGFGMGLTVASELVAGYGNRMRLVTPGKLGGASFAFTLPLSVRNT